MHHPYIGVRQIALVFLAATISCLTHAADAPRPWPPDAFRPVTAQRITALPAAEQPAWRAYWEKSQGHTKDLRARDLVDHSSTKRLAGPPIPASYSKGVRLDAPAAWYATEEARVIADRVVNWQTPAGGWTKDGDYSRDRQPADDHHDSWSAGTFDNDATIYELRYLALVNAAAPADTEPGAARARAWRECFLRGLDYILAAQYPNGGFPQIYPLAGGYHDAITFNDDAMVHILELLRDISDRKDGFAFVSAEQAARARQALKQGISCVLATQLKAPDGRRTVWGQQHDALDLTPCAARNFEPSAECSNESVGLVQFLMTVPHPSPEVIAAIDGAMEWFTRRALHDVVWNRSAPAGTDLAPQAGAPALWARYYEFGTGKPIFGERDRTIHYSAAELTLERRNGYGWFNDRPAALFPHYAKWKKSLPGAAVSTP